MSVLKKKEHGEQPPGADLARMGRLVRAGRVPSTAASAHVITHLDGAEWVESVLSWIAGLGDTLRIAFLDLGDPDAGPVGAAVAAMELIRARDELASHHVALQLARIAAAGSTELAKPLDVLGSELRGILDWADGEADRWDIVAAASEALSRIHPTLRTSLETDDLVEMARIAPDSWWLAPLLLPPPSVLRRVATAIG